MEAMSDPFHIFAKPKTFEEHSCAEVNNLSNFVFVGTEI